MATPCESEKCVRLQCECLEEKKNEGLKEIFLNYSSKNMISVLSAVFTVVGIGVFVWYYAEIGYMPVFNFASSVTFLAASAGTSFLLLLFFVLLFILPGTIWGWWIKENSHLKEHFYKDDGTFITWKKIVWFVIPSLSAFSILLLEINLDNMHDRLFVGLFGIVIIVLYVIAVACFIDVSQKEFDKQWIFALKEVSKVIAISAFSASLILFPLLIVTGFALDNAARTNSDFMAYVSFGASIFFLVWMNYWVVDLPSSGNKFYWILGLGFIVFIAISAINREGNKIPNYVMGLYKFGNIPTDMIIVKGDVCDVLKTEGVLGFTSNDTDTDTDTSKCYLRDANILSRLGEAYYIKVQKNASNSDESPKNTVFLTFEVKAKDVISWMVREVETKSK